MKKEYDLSQMKRIKNPYAKLLKKVVTMRIEPATIGYFKNLSRETGITYQNLINLYLMDCAGRNRKLSMKWD